MPSRDPVITLIAEPSRLGGEVLSRILQPLVSTTLCPDQTSLDEALGKHPRPDVLLLAHDWPEAAQLLSGLSPDIRLVLLASAETSRKKLTALTDAAVPVIHKPYQAREVVAALLQALHDRGSTTPPVSPAADLADGLTRDLAFCKRHGMMLSMLALDFPDYHELCREIGAESVREAQQSLAASLRRVLRHEDSLCMQGPGRLVFSLPGTPPAGARTLAHRITSWLEQTNLSQGDFDVHFNVRTAIHCHVPGGEADAASLLEEVLAVLEQPEPAATAHRVSALAATLSEVSLDANTISADENDQAPFWQALDTLLRHPDFNSPHQQAILLERLAPILDALPEQQRLKLVDQLLMASVSPDAAQ